MCDKEKAHEERRQQKERMCDAVHKKKRGEERHTRRLNVCMTVCVCLSSMTEAHNLLNDDRGLFAKH